MGKEANDSLNRSPTLSLREANWTPTFSSRPTSIKNTFRLLRSIEQGTAPLGTRLIRRGDGNSPYERWPILRTNDSAWPSTDMNEGPPKKRGEGNNSNGETKDETRDARPSYLHSRSLSYSDTSGKPDQTTGLPFLKWREGRPALPLEQYIGMHPMLFFLSVSIYPLYSFTIGTALSFSAHTYLTWADLP